MHLAYVYFGAPMEGLSKNVSTKNGNQSLLVQDSPFRESFRGKNFSQARASTKHRQDKQGGSVGRTCLGKFSLQPQEFGLSD